VITLKPLTREDVNVIRYWPPYPRELVDLDYASREGGWLDEFPESPTTRRFVAWNGSHLVGFSILTDIANGNAEFYIALHPGWIGRGIGREVTNQTLAIGFEQLDLRRIYLKVRDWHERAIALYESVGFRKFGTCVADVHGQPVHFVTMEIRKPLRPAPRGH
jgi:RimJ/RimL family protein N-acetyltransferase